MIAPLKTLREAALNCSHWIVYIENPKDSQIIRIVRVSARLLGITSIYKINWISVHC